MRPSFKCSVASCNERVSWQMPCVYHRRLRTLWFGLLAFTLVLGVFCLLGCVSQKRYRHCTAMLAKTTEVCNELADRCDKMVDACEARGKDDKLKIDACDMALEKLYKAKPVKL